MTTTTDGEREARFFNTAWRKVIWLWLQPMFLGLRPMILYPKAMTDLEFGNLAMQGIYNVCVIYFGGWKAMAYLFFGTWLGLGIHPTSGHLISSHFVFEDGQETSSYYGPLNLVTFNIGYHNEHHDFPFVTGSNLPKVQRAPMNTQYARFVQVRAMAPEYYDSLVEHKSWLAYLWRFVVDPAMGLRSRTKRHLVTSTATHEYYGNYSCHMFKALQSVFGSNRRDETVKEE